MLTLIRFIKNWTLPISMGIGALVYLIFYYVPALDTLSQKLASYVRHYTASVYVPDTVRYFLQGKL